MPVHLEFYKPQMQVFPVQSIPDGGGRKILMAITELDVGGAEKAFVQIAVGLAHAGWDVTAVSLRKRGPLANELESHGIMTLPLNSCCQLDLRSIFRLRSILRRLRPDVLLTFLHEANLWGRLAAKGCGIPLVVSGIRVADRRLAVVIPERLTGCCVDLYVAVSDDVGRTHAELCRIPSGKMAVIRNGVDIDGILAAIPVPRDRIGVEPGDFVFVFVGRLTEQKAPLDLVRAFAELPAAYRTQSKLVFVGDGPLRSDLESKVVAAGLENEVRILGWQDDAIGIIKAANALVLTSRWEGLPNVVLESLAAGIPVIAADVDGVRDLVAAGHRISVFPAGEVSRVSGLMKQAIDVARDLKNGGGKLQVIAPQVVTWSDVAAEYSRVLAEQLADKAIRTR